MLFCNIILGILLVFILLVVALISFPYASTKVCIFILRHTVYKIDAYNLKNIPKNGPVLLVSNHVSALDGLIIMGLTGRKVHFMMHQKFYRNKFMHRFYKRIGIIEVPNAIQAKRMQVFFDEVKERLRNNEVVCVFPEGGVSENGLISQFKKGMKNMLPEEINVPILPVRIGMIRGSIFVIFNGKIKFVKPHCFPIPLSVCVGNPVQVDITPYQLRQVISEMGADVEKNPYKGEKPIHYFFLRKAKYSFFRFTYKDSGQKGVSNFMMLLKSLLISKLVKKLYNQNIEKFGKVDDKKVKELVGVLLPNCTNLIAVIFGILYNDKTPAILNFSSGHEIIKKVVTNSEIKMIITSRKFLEKIKMQPLPEMIFLEDVAPLIKKSDKLKTLLQILFLPATYLMSLYAPLSKKDLQRVCVVLFSSGSTGIPKGVMLTHHNLNSNIQSFQRTINWSTKDHVIGNLPVFHAYGCMINFAFPAVSGTKVSFVLSPLDATTICNTVAEDKCTLVMATPTFLQGYMRKYKSGQFASVRLVVTGAEKLRHDISTKFYQMTGLEIVEGFGCTELSPIVSINLSQSIFNLGKESGKQGSIGAPLPGVHVKIVNPETLEELPENQSGLMLVKGGLVMKGYLNNFDATEQVMLGDYYATGDIASMSNDGYLTITGRLSRVSKIAGEMVPHELIEMSINEILQSEERVIAVSSRHDEKRGERLVVFYATDKLEPAKIVEELKMQNLPNLWIPKVDDFQRIEKIPLLGAGKIDLQALKKMAEELK